MLTDQLDLARSNYLLLNEKYFKGRDILFVFEMAAKEDEFYLIFGVLFILIAALGVSGNVITLILIKKNESFRDTSNGRLFLGNLAVADLLNSILAMFSGLGYISKDIIMDGHVILCYSAAYSRRFLPYLAIFALTLLTINRYCITLYYKKTGRFFRRKSSWMYVISSWLLLFLPFLGLPFLDTNTTPTFQNDRGLCNVTLEPISSVNIYLGSLCIFSLCYFNTRIYLRVKRHNRSVRDKNLIIHFEYIEKNKKVAKIVLVMFISYVICYLPVIIRGIFLSAKVHAGPLWSPLAFLFYNINYINNFFIYGVMDKTYRRKLKKLLCKNLVQHGATPFETSTQR